MCINGLSSVQAFDGVLACIGVASSELALLDESVEDLQENPFGPRVGKNPCVVV